MKLYSYIVTYDTGFAPNPFWGYCTLATCKPAIRRTACKGDWIVGLSPKSAGNKIIYAMQVNEILPFDKYYRDPRFQVKIPDYSREQVVFKCGDNIYEPLPNDEFRQLPSQHSYGELENPYLKNHDLNGKNVLVSENFYYFGSKPIRLPQHLSVLKVGRAHKCRFSDETVQAFVDIMKENKPGVLAPPSSWPQDDDSWRSQPR